MPSAASLSFTLGLCDLTVALVVGCSNERPPPAARGCVMTPCGTHALHMALDLVGVGPGDEVVVAPFTYIATIDVILMCYALPVFADTEPKTFQIDPNDIEHRITEHTRAILPVHISGAPAHMDKFWLSPGNMTFRWLRMRARLTPPSGKGNE